MPIASLSRFTVPLSGTQAAGTQGLLMPKLKYRFRVVTIWSGKGKYSVIHEMDCVCADILRSSVFNQRVEKYFENATSKILLCGLRSVSYFSIMLL